MDNVVRQVTDQISPDTSWGQIAKAQAANINNALTNRAFAQALSPVSQTTPTVATDILVAVLKRKASGIFVIQATVGWTGVNTDTYTLSLRQYQQATVLTPLGNASPVLNSGGLSVATASGTITYTGSPSPTTIATTGAIETITGELVQQITLTGPGIIASGTPFAAFALSVVASAGNFVAIANSTTMVAYELP